MDARPADLPITVPQIREILEGVAANFGALTCEIDGVPIKHLHDFLEFYSVFSLTVSVNNIFGLGTGFLPSNSPAGLFAPDEDTGVHLMVARFLVATTRFTLRPTPWTPALHSTSRTASRWPALRITERVTRSLSLKSELAESTVDLGRRELSDERVTSEELQEQTARWRGSGCLRR